MADRRRRRIKLGEGDDSEVGSDESEDELNGTRKSTAGSDGGDSEYESADEEELGEEEEEEEDDDLLIIPDGVGEDNKQLDDDEDRKNPQYIPKKGTFYEHDDRTAAEEDAEKPVEEPQTNKKEVGKKKVWKEDDRWKHDKFNEYDQAPKSRDELVQVYGYDIRNEEGPPRARRRRRYGRGPNKYTRNWEDLDAYTKPVRGGGTPGSGVGMRGFRGGQRSLTGSRKTLESDEEFPALGQNRPGLVKQELPHPEHRDDSRKVETFVAKVDSQRMPTEPMYKGEPNNTKQHSPAQPHQHPPQLQQQQQHIKSPQPQDVRSEMQRGRGGGRGRGRGAWRGGGSGSGGFIRDQQHRYNEERSGHNYGDVRISGRGGRGGGSPQQHQQQQQQQRAPHQYNPREMDELNSDMKNVNINSQNRDDMYRNKNRGGGNTDNRRNTVPPRLQDSAAAVANMGRGGRGGGGGSSTSPGADSSSSRPKRYSSQRQRSIPEQSVPPYPQQHGYIDTPVEPSYQGSGVSETGIATSATPTATAAPHTQLPPTFVAPAFTTSPPTYPPEPFLGRPPAPRMFPPVTQAPHLFAAPVAPPPVPVPPVAGPPLGAPPVGAPTVPGPPVTGPPFLPPENMINFGGHPGPLPGAAPHPPQFPPFQGYTPGPVSQPGEIYSNGVTYYNTETQQHLPRINPILQKRPKAAIPIVPPPERERKRQEQQQLAAQEGYILREEIEDRGYEDESGTIEDERGEEGDIGIGEQQMRDLERLVEQERQLEQEKALEQVRLMEEDRAREQERLEAEQQQDVDPTPEAKNPSTNISNDEQLTPTITSTTKDEPPMSLEIKQPIEEKIAMVAEPITTTTTITTPSSSTEQTPVKAESKSTTNTLTSEEPQADSTTTDITQPTSSPAELSSSTTEGSKDESKTEVANQPSSSTETPDVAVAAS
ncbi:hypothetical protein Pmani_022595 [Petrolisthes manimaculis]|uniref:Protein CASC3 n=1 Tax=Petrolisthes manimaculis TaxID=1843537 RepID=A0AAE1PE14_9EUCA|nr:hypothetical protein Pmani_022595 [Petrolisthes manimaculis]